MPPSEIQSTLVISNSKGLSEILKRYPYLDISGLLNLGKNESNSHI